MNTFSLHGPVHPSFPSNFTIKSCGPVGKARHICIWGTMGCFEKLVTSIQNGTFGQTLYLPCLARTYCVCLAFCTFSIISRPHFDCKTTTDDCVSDGTVMYFAAQVVVCSFCSYIWSSHHDSNVHMTSVLLPDKATGSKCSDIILHSMCSMSLMHLFNCIVPSKTFTVRFCPIPNQILVCRSPIRIIGGVMSSISIVLSTH